MSDLELVEALQHGNTSVLKQCYKHLSLIEKFVQKNSGNIQDSHDIFQDTLIIFYKNVSRPDFVLSSKISTYLFGIARRLWLHQLRKTNKMVTVNVDQLNDHQLVSNFSFELEQADGAQFDIRNLLSDMGEPCKSILDMFYFRNMKLNQIAIELAYKNEQVVRQQKYRCLKDIRKKFQSMKLDLEQTAR